MLNRRHHMPPAERPGFGIIEKGIRTGPDLKTLHQQIGFVARWQISGLGKCGKGKQEKGQSCHRLFKLHGYWFIWGTAVQLHRFIIFQ